MKNLKHLIPPARQGKKAHSSTWGRVGGNTMKYYKIKDFSRTQFLEKKFVFQL